LQSVDLHLHLLPGIDDGAPDVRTAVAHARRMAAAGVVEAACTPHVKHCFPDVVVDEVPDRTAALQVALDDAGIALRLHAGAELDWRRATELTAGELEGIALGPPEQRWVLLEAPFEGVHEGFCAVAEELLESGYGVLLAHPERAPGVLGGGRRRLARLLDAGCRLQVNAASLVGEHGAEPRAAAVALLRAGRVFALASDGHPGTRGEVLPHVARRALRAAGAPAAELERLIATNPRRLLPAEVGAIR
jgi:protein-tyrosine phosphatase